MIPHAGSSMLARACVQTGHTHTRQLYDKNKTDTIGYAYKYDTPTLAKLYDIKTRYDIQ